VLRSHRSGCLYQNRADIQGGAIMIVDEGRIVGFDK
jgi:hypothetical protein